VRAAVTGATGFLGRHLVRALIERGHHVRALVRRPERAGLLPEEASGHPGDLTDEGSLRGLAEGADVFFHLGAATSGDWRTHRAATVEGTRRALRLSAESSVARFVHVSSIVVFDTRGLRPCDTISDSSPLASPDPAVGPYARGKIEAERLVLEGGRNDAMWVTILRPGLVYGPGRTLFPHLGTLVGNLFLAVGGGGILLPLCSVASVTDALLRLAETDAPSGSAYTLVDENETTRADYLLVLGELTGRGYRTIHVPIWPVAAAGATVGALRRLPGLGSLPETSSIKVRSRALSLRYDTSSLQKGCGWRPPEPLRVALARALAGEQAGHPVTVSGQRVGAPRASARRPGAGPGRRAGRGREGHAMRVGIIGAGTVAALHIRALRRIAGAEIAGLLDVDAAAARTVGARHDIAASYDDARTFYEEAKPEIVHVLTPPQTHHEISVEALRRGIHVLTEKPMAMTPQECSAMSAAAEEGGVTLGVDHNLLFDRRVLSARRIVGEGGIGEIVHVETIFGFDIRRSPRFSRESGAREHWAHALPGGLLEDLLPHPLYLTLTFLGREAEMTGSHVNSSGRLGRGFSDELRLSMSDGRASASIGLSLSIQPDLFTLSIYGSGGILELDLMSMLVRRHRPRRLPRPLARGLLIGETRLHDLLATAWNVASVAVGAAHPPGDVTPLIRAHYASLAQGDEVPVGYADGVRTVEVIRKIWPI
jgi:predicted dehydrogenase